jgi:hypothetical protein
MLSRGENGFYNYFKYKYKTAEKPLLRGSAVVLIWFFFGG